MIIGISSAQNWEPCRPIVARLEDGRWIVLEKAERDPLTGRIVCPVNRLTNIQKEEILTLESP